MAGPSARSAALVRALVLPLGLASLGVVELGAGCWASRRAAVRFGAAEALVRELRQPGDKLVVAPGWADPLAREALPAEPLRDLGASRLDAYPGVVEVSLLGAHAPLGAFREVARREAGGLVVRRLENPSPVRVLTDFVDALRPSSAEVLVRGRGAHAVATPCLFDAHARVQTGGLGGHPTFPAERFECPGGPFFHVGVTVIADERFRPRRCLFAHPRQHDDVVLRYPRVPLGSRIEGHSGLTWMVEREQKGAPVTLEVRVGGASVGTVTHRDGEGFAPFDLALGEHGEREADVEFVVRSANFLHRHFCFEAQSR
jgi:hypothetical protein